MEPDVLEARAQWLEAHAQSLWPPFRAHLLRDRVTAALRQGTAVLGWRFRHVADPGALSGTAAQLCPDAEAQAHLTWLSFTLGRGAFGQILPHSDVLDQELFALLNPHDPGDHVMAFLAIPPLRDPPDAAA